MSIEAMKQAINQAISLLVKYKDFTGDFRIANKCGSAIYALEKAIEQAETQEPVAWMVLTQDDKKLMLYGEEKPPIFNTPVKLIPLYTAPPKQEIEQKHVAWDDDAWGKAAQEMSGDFVKRVKANWESAPKREWVGLTDVEVGKYSDRLNGGDIAREVEAKLKDKNNA